MSKPKRKRTLSPTAIYAGRAIGAFAARVQAEGQTLTITCPRCTATWDVEAGDLTSTKTCSTCGHVWEPSLGDYAAGIKRGEEMRMRAGGKARAKNLADVAAGYYGDRQ